LKLCVARAQLATALDLFISVQCYAASPREWET
jgi:hypothetical protein